MEPHIQAIIYQLNILTEEDSVDWYAWNLYVEYGGRGRWAVTRGFQMSPRSVLNADDEWEYEGSSDRMDEDWLAQTRFDLDDALERAKRMLPLVRINGLTPSGVLDKRRAERAAELP